jgi:putative heme-binding domain-containing protein
MPETLLAALAARGGMSLPLRLRKGEPAAVAEAVALLSDAKAGLEDRILCVRTLGEMRPAGAAPALLALAADAKSPDAVRRTALSALSGFDSEEIPAKLLRVIPSASADVQSAAFAALASRPRWAAAMVQEIQSGRLPISSVPLEIVEALRVHPDKTVSAASAALFPAGQGGGNWQEKIARVEAALKVPGGSPYEGEKIFAQRCAGCHRLFFKGGTLGPDLTHYQRDNLGTMLVSIVNPNAEIREGFACQMVETASGQTLSGYVAERTDSLLRLRTLDGQTAVIAAAEVKSVAPLGRSLMPEGLLEGLSDAQLRDLFAWLRQSQPITK